MNTFPTISRGPSLNFSDEKSDEAVLVADVASGYPQPNKQFTFDPRTFKFDMPNVPDADKLTVIAFYEANKDLSFYWTNDQDGVQYEVVFLSKPRCRIDGRIDFWRIGLSLRLSSP